MYWRYVLAVLCACGATAKAADPEMHWFTNQAMCDGARIVVRSYCEVSRREHAVVPRNTACTEQELLIKPLGKPSIKLDLLEHEPLGDDFHIATGLRCVATDKQHYLLIDLDTGGSCDTCEISAVTDLRGRWRQYGKRWFAAPAEQREIRTHEAGWRRLPAVDLSNTVREREAEE